MSRINDALKRAQRAQKKQTPAPDVRVPRLLPVEPRPGTAIGWILPGVIGVLIVAACLFIGMALLTRTVTKANSEPALAVAEPVKPAVVPSSIPAPQATTTTTTSPASQALPPQPPPAPPPEPRLQGIVYGAAQPWAIVDGQTVRVGDRLGEFRVKDISQSSVTLEKADGSQKKLGLDK
ncbi:MAG: hypothetical protein WBW41_11325 [Verrucomicrobiia bacterium]